MTVLVLGGRGFIGRHAVRALEKQGVRVTIGSRHATTARAATPGTRSLPFQALTTPEAWMTHVEPFSAVLNCVGILRQRRGESYDLIHHRVPGALATACARAGKRYVHVSALGLAADAKSRFLTSKYHGEQAVMQAGGDWIIARPSLLDGEGGYGAAWLRAVARLPFFVAPTSARGRIAALTVTDAGDALARLCLADAPSLALERSREFELGGPRSYAFAAYVQGLRRRERPQPALCVPLPGLLARLGAHLCDLVHFSPFSFGHWELLCKDNVPSENRLPELLGRAPEAVIPDG